ncbi:MAG: ABC transporter ATP-binding protein [Candidatus Atribacteria bacterium]|nr:ABC transporter ATP-binding protein [Candidatus Atribacteria bacterium]
MSESFLTLKNLTKEFQVGTFFSKVKILAIQDVTLELERKPTVFTLVGESGSGKTTLANFLLRVLKPTEGSITFLGKNIESYKKFEFMKLVQPIFQNPYETFNPLKKVETYFCSVIKKLRITSENGHSFEKVIEKALSSVALTWEEVKDKYPNEFSGGQLQRLSIARALMVNPMLLVADEPVSMLDASLRVFVLNLFRKLKEEKQLYIIYITHDLATAYYISDYIGVMLRGSLVEVGPAEKVLLNPLHPYTVLLKESVPNPDEIKKKQEVRIKEERILEIEEFLEQGCKFALRCPYVQEICKKEMPQDVIVEGVAVKCWLYSKKKKEGFDM